MGDPHRSGSYAGGGSTRWQGISVQDQLSILFNRGTRQGMMVPAAAHSGKMTRPPIRCILACLLLLLPVSSAAQHDERSVRAAFVFHLTKYVEWPNPKNELV